MDNIYKLNEKLFDFFKNTRTISLAVKLPCLRNTYVVLSFSAVINYAGDLSCPPDEKPIEKRKPILGGIIRKNIRGRIRNDSDDEDTEH